MKKHSLQEHVDDVWNWKLDHGLSSYNPDGMVGVTIWFTAYERWLNDRDLLTEEDVRSEARAENARP